MNMKEQKPTKETETTEPVKMRQIIIETDGTDIHIVKSETAGKIELIAILQTIIGHLSQPTK